MNAKLPASFDGRVSWLRYEDLVRDWVTFAQVETQGPLLKNQLTHDAPICRELLDNNRLVDRDNGVEYFLTTLRGYVLKGSQNVLYRFLSFFNHRRRTGEFVTFISAFEILLRRLRASWEDTAPTYTQDSPEYVQATQEANQRLREQCAEQVAQAQQMMAGQARRAAAPVIPDPVILDPADPAVCNQFTAGRQTQHTQAFPLSDNLVTLFSSPRAS